MVGAPGLTLGMVHLEQQTQKKGCAMRNGTEGAQEAGQGSPGEDMSRRSGAGQQWESSKDLGKVRIYEDEFSLSRSVLTQVRAKWAEAAEGWAEVDAGRMGAEATSHSFCLEGQVSEWEGRSSR